MLSVIVAMDILPGTQLQFLRSGPTLIVILLSFEVRRRFGNRPGEDDDGAAARSESKEPGHGTARPANELHTDSVKIVG